MFKNEIETFKPAVDSYFTQNRKTQQLSRIVGGELNKVSLISNYFRRPRPRRQFKHTLAGGVDH